jgi:predicted metal-dependent phosphoesterase TrpH
MRTNIDLHMHSLYSDDGEFTPTELVEQCHNANIEVMAIADHNFVKAIDEAKAAAKKYAMSVIPAIEIDCVYKGINLHVLGYGIDYHHPSFNKLGEDILKQELLLSDIKLEKTNALFHTQLTREQLLSIMPNGVFTGEAFAQALLEDERYLQLEALKPYREKGERSDNPYVNFYWDYYSQGKAIYTKVNYPSLEEIIKLIKSHGGISILAHPGNNLKNQFELFDEMVQLGLDGVEAFSSYHDQKTCEYFYNKAKELNVYYTCGSDFHGKTKPSIHLGDCHCNVEINIDLKGLAHDE